jgi:microsomal dipeptidase-like Zn-dependent dipeptidase
MKIKITLDKLHVTDNGDPSHETNGELYYNSKVDGKSLVSQSKSNPKNVKDKATIQLNKSKELDVNNKETIKVSGYVGDVDKGFKSCKIERKAIFNRILTLVFSCVLLANYALARDSAPVTSGYVLTHEHPTYGMAFGGNYAFAGATGNYKHGIMEKGYTAQCGGCKALGNCDHGEVKGAFTAFTGGLGADMGDHKSHMGPLHASNSHLRYSTEWTKEAFAPSEEEFRDTNMKIMVAFAVENEAMCEQLYYANKGNGGAGGNGYACTKGDSIKSLERQLNNIKAWVRENSDWMEIAYSATDARRIVNSNKLAIILGIESEYSFGAEDRTFDPVNRLNRYYDQGVRTFYLAHKINSRLSGADMFMPQGSMAGRALRMTQAVSGCFYYDDNIGDFPLEGRLGKNLCDNNCGDNAFKGGKITDQCSFKFSDISEVNFIDYISRGAGAFNGFNLYPKPPGFTGSAGTHMEGDIERNNLGLSHDGERVVREAMTKGMIVNIDHISSLARDQIHTLATEEFGNYPLNALHNKPNNRLTNRKKFKRHEYDFDRDELKYVRDSGGFFGLRMGPTDSLEYSKSGITADCPKTSTETAKMLAWLIDEGLNVGYSLDFATVTEGVHSRTMHNCEFNELGDDRIHKYGVHVTEGLSHIGMMKKWHAELASIGLKKGYLDTLKNKGVEAFLQMWQNSEAKAGTGRQIPRKIFKR